MMSRIAAKVRAAWRAFMIPCASAPTRVAALRLVLAAAPL